MRSQLYSAAVAGALVALGASEAAAQWSGPFTGVEMLGSLDSVDTTETTAATGGVFHKFTSSGGGIGGGIDLGYNWQVGQLVVGALASFDGLNNGAGRVLHTSDGYAGLLEARLGYLTNPVLLWYGETGLALAQENVTANLGGPTTGLTRTATGYALGGGVEWALPAHTLPIAGTSLFFDYQHIWWDSGSMTTPAAAPNLDFRWQRESNIVRLGVRLHF